MAIGNSNTTSVTFDGVDYNVGGTGTLTVTAAASGGDNSGENILFTGGALAEVKTSDQIIDFNGTISLGASSPVSFFSDGGAITIDSVMGASTDVALVVNANATDGDTSETISIGAIGSGNEIGAITLTANDSITLTGNITTANAAGADLDLSLIHI